MTETVALALITTVAGVITKILDVRLSKKNNSDEVTHESEHKERSKDEPKRVDKSV